MAARPPGRAGWLPPLAFAALRRRSGSLAGPIVFHWLAMVAMNAALFAQAD